jgi:hypothetical protein
MNRYQKANFMEGCSMPKKVVLIVSVLSLVLMFGIAYSQMSYPEALSDEIGQYPGSKIMVTNDLGEELQIVMTSNDDVKDIAKYYKSGLKDKGWKIEGNVMAGPSAALSFSKGDGVIDIAIADHGSMKMISVNYLKSD